MEKYPESSLEEVTASLIGDAFDEIERKYGADGEHPKGYHNLEHTKAVFEAAQAIADKAYERGKISHRDTLLIAIAAAYHDVEHGLAGDESERASAVVARNKMEEVGVFTEEDVQKVEDAIMGTRV